VGFFFSSSCPHSKQQPTYNTAMSMRIDILTLFPEMFTDVLNSSILKRAAASLPDPNDPENIIRPPVVSYHLTDIRDHTQDKHGKVDKPPYGGGPGMVIQCQPVWDAVAATEAADPRPAMRILMTPQGERLNQKLVNELADQNRLLIIAGHYEGIDERVIQKLAPLREISIGDYVLSGGELPAMVLIDTIVRLLPGALGDEKSAAADSFGPALDQEGRLLDYPHYTRPADWTGLEVPKVLLSGDHGKIAAWRAQQSRDRTAQRRPDLLTDSGDDT
jgi:tRNA (guanine37-N1)-methyltransferase